MKKLAIVVLTIIVSSAVLSGCFSEGENEAITIPPKNEAPVAIISTSGTISSPPNYIDLTMIDAVAYDGDTVTFDASNSYDSDGKILSYEWIWEDNSDSQGLTATRQFYIDDVFNLHGLPLIFSIILNIEDNDGSITLIDYRLGVIPKGHSFYFAPNRLTLEEPSAGKDGVTASFGKFRTVQELDYELEESLFFQPCDWNATIYLEKSLLSIVNKITIVLYDVEGKEIARKDENLGLVPLWKEKAIKMTGSLDTATSFKSAKLIVYGFSLRENVYVSYGGGKASYIGFDFTA